MVTLLEQTARNALTENIQGFWVILHFRCINCIKTFNRIDCDGRFICVNTVILTSLFMIYDLFNYIWSSEYKACIQNAFNSLTVRWHWSNARKIRAGVGMRWGFLYKRSLLPNSTSCLSCIKYNVNVSSCWWCNLSLWFLKVMGCHSFFQSLTK